MANEIQNREHAIATFVPVVAAPFSQQILNAVGVDSFVRNSAGNYTVTLTDAIGFSGAHAAAALPANFLGIPGAQISEDGKSILVTCFDLSGTPVDPPLITLVVRSIVEGEGIGPAPALPPPPGSLFLYVRDADGDDANPGTIDLPFKTIQAAVDQVPQNVDHQVIIRVGVHTGTGYAMPQMGIRNVSARIYIYGDGAGVGTGQIETLASEVSAAGTDLSKMVSPNSHTLDEFQGQTLEITDGVCAGYRRTLHSNTAGPDTEFLFIADTDGLGLVPSAGDSYRIFRPAVVINLSEGQVAGATVQAIAGDSAQAGVLVFAQIAMFATQAQVLNIDGVNAVMLGVEQDQANDDIVTWRNSNQQTFHGSEDVGVVACEIAVALGAPDAAAWNGYATHWADGGTTPGGPLEAPDGVGGQSRALAVGFLVVAKRIFCQIDALLYGGYYTDGISCTGPSECRMTTNNTITNRMKFVVSGTTDCINVQSRCRLNLRSVDLEWEDGEAFNIRTSGIVEQIFCEGAPGGTGDTVRCSGGGSYYPFGPTPVLGRDGGTPDHFIDGVAVGINKVDLNAAGVGIAGVSGSSISKI